jgi:hypothetical protein
MSRANDATIDLRPGLNHAPTDTIDQVRNGNRWRVAAVDPNTNRIAAERLTDKARAVFESDYVKRTRHGRVCSDGAFVAGGDRRQLPRPAWGVCGTGDAARGDDRWPVQQRGVPVSADQRISGEADPTLVFESPDYLHPV